MHTQFKCRSARPADADMTVIPVTRSKYECSQSSESSSPGARFVRIMAAASGRAARQTKAIASALLVTLGSTTAALVLSTGTAHAALDNQQTLIDSAGDTLTIQQWDTFLNGVTPLDRNRLTREWFQSGRVAYTVTGPNADTFSGTVELGYQVSFPWALGVGLNFSYSTPNVLNDGAPVLNPGLFALSPNILPGVTINTDLTNGPGNQEVATFSAPVAGKSGAVRIANAHGTITGADGGVVLRPYARLTSKTSAGTVSTYGDPWDMG
jgi:MspA